jgi:hypothetical protein
MPEIVTKHPEVLLKVLKDAKIACGTGAKQQILTQCPKDQFCALPTGELCVYGTKQMSQLTQIQAVDLLFAPGVLFMLVGAVVLGFLGGLWVGVSLLKRG